MINYEDISSPKKEDVSYVNMGARYQKEGLSIDRRLIEENNDKLLRILRKVHRSISEKVIALIFLVRILTLFIW